MHGEHITEVELVVFLALRPPDLFDATGEAFRPDRDFHGLAVGEFIRRELHLEDFAACRRRLFHLPEAAIEQALAPVVAQAHELVAGGRQRTIKPAPLPHAGVVGAARGVAADQHLVGLDHPLRIERVAPDHLGLPELAEGELLAGSDIHRQPDDRIVLRLPVHFGQHGVGGSFGEEAAAGDRRQLRRVAQHQERHAERFQIAPEFFIDHRAFVDDNQFRLRCGRLVPEFEARGGGTVLDRPVDQAVDGRGPLAALAAHHQGRLPGEGPEQHLAVHALGEVLGKGGLAGAGVTEQAENDRSAALARLGLEPARDRIERCILVGSKNGHKPRTRRTGIRC